MCIRPVSSDDGEAWLELRCALWPEGSRQEHRTEIDSFFAGTAREPQAVLVADREHEIVGFVELSIRPYAEGCTSNRVAFLEGWYVAPAYRCRGTGKSLVAAAEAWAREQGCSELASDTEVDNEVSRAAHRECGFAEVGVLRCFMKELPDLPGAQTAATGTLAKRNRSMPPGAVIPELPYPDVGAAVAWLCAAFGFTERLRIADHRSQIAVGDGAVVAIQAREGFGKSSLMIRVDDVDAHYEHALRSGATLSGQPVTFPYGERQYTARDPAGHCWTFSQSVADTDPADWGGRIVSG